MEEGLVKKIRGGQRAPKWVVDSIFYQVFPDRFANGDPGNDPAGTVSWGSKPTRENFFGGDLRGILEHLPYLEDLGVTAIYLNPIFKARSNHKYDTCDYFVVDPAFGTKELLRKFVNEAHRRNIHVVLDAVFNHCGECFWAFEDVKKNGVSSKYNSWFFVDSYPISMDPPSYQTYGGTWYLPKLNTSNPETREYLLKVAVYWIEECDIDGWRLDVPWKVPFDFWQTLRERVKQVKPDVYILGEVWRDPSKWLRGDTCDGVMNYPLRDHIIDYCIRDSLDAEDFDYEISHLREIHGSASPYQVNLLGSHDTPRLLTLCNGDIDRVIMAMTFIFTYIGAPMIYYGDEVGVMGSDDPDCRRCMPWDEIAWNQELVRAIRALIHARRDHLALRKGNFEKLWAFNGVYAYKRCYKSDEVIVIMNPRETRYSVKVPVSVVNERARVWRDLLSGETFNEEEGNLLLETLPSKASYVLFPDQ